MKTIINWKVFFILWIAAIVAVILLLPYAFEVQSSAIDLTKLPLPFPVVLVIQILQNAIIFAVAVFAVYSLPDVSVSRRRFWMR
jgi:hypothetical protein